MPDVFCPVCKDKLYEGYCEWHLLCNSCGYEKSELQPSINCNLSNQLINENARKTGLRELRAANFDKLVKVLKSLKPTGGRLLDVGCGHGWFLEAAKKDFEVFGIEPDKKVLASLKNSKFSVRKGYFPEALKQSERFDIIIFNDVFEHLLDVNNTLAHCYQRLNKDGLLLLNMPNSKGLFYKLSKIPLRIGILTFFERLWQKGLPSPHLHYFNIQNTVKLLENNGFRFKIIGSLPTLCLDGLYERIAYTGSYNTAISFIIFVIIALLLPLIKILPNDIFYVIAKRI